MTKLLQYNLRNACKSRPDPDACRALPLPAQLSSQLLSFKRQPAITDLIHVLLAHSQISLLTSL
jgi:hypothetical protein